MTLEARNDPARVSAPISASLGPASSGCLLGLARKKVSQGAHVTEGSDRRELGQPKNYHQAEEKNSGEGWPDSLAAIEIAVPKPF